MPLEVKKKFSELLFRPRRFLKSASQKKEDSELLFRPRRFLRRYGQRAISIDKRVWGNTFWRKGGVVTKVLTSTHFR